MPGPSDKPFTLDISSYKDQSAVGMMVVSGYLDAHTVHDFNEKTVGSQRPDFRLLIADIRGLDYISSAGIASLVKLRQDCQGRDGDIVYLKPEDKVYKALDLVGLGEVFHFRDTPEEAFEFLRETYPGDFSK